VLIKPCIHVSQLKAHARVYFSTYLEEASVLSHNFARQKTCTSRSSKAEYPHFRVFYYARCYAEHSYSAVNRLSVWLRPSVYLWRSGIRDCLSAL